MKNSLIFKIWHPSSYGDDDDDDEDDSDNEWFYSILTWVDCHNHRLKTSRKDKANYKFL